MKLSVITINYNNREGLQRTIESVVSQTWQDFEYIVIDGGSTDGSVDVIKEFVDYIDYWVSEPDQGIYDAMNKGIEKATGEYCLFMNSADTIYQPTTLSEVYPYLKEAEIISGKMLLNTGQWTSPPQNITLKYFFKGTLSHQATFILRSLLNKYPYDTKYRIVSDWKFWVEALICGNCTYKPLEQRIAIFDGNGISSSNWDDQSQERKSSFMELFPPRVLIDYHTLLYGDTYEDKLYLIIKSHKYHKVFYALNIWVFKIVAIFNHKTQWVKKFPFNI